MDELKWFNEIALPCEKAKTVRGGAMCYYVAGMKDYCSYDHCPKRNK